MISVLCCSKNSIYKTLGVDCYDIDRDARTFDGSTPIIAHPPFRAWSAYCSHQAKYPPEEKELAPMCVQWLAKCGGILEHPAHSRLWSRMRIPLPGEYRNGMHCIEVNQCWWGDSRTKKTWLLLSKIDMSKLVLPPPVEVQDDRESWSKMSKDQRSATHPSFARWLIELVGTVPIISIGPIKGPQSLSKDNTL